MDSHFGRTSTSLSRQPRRRLPLKEILAWFFLLMIFYYLSSNSPETAPVKYTARFSSADKLVDPASLVDAIVYIAMGKMAGDPLVEYSIASVRKLGKWNGDIYLVTDNAACFRRVQQEYHVQLVEIPSVNSIMEIKATKARLLQLLPENVNGVLYIDIDIVITKNLEYFFRALSSTVPTHGSISFHFDEHGAIRPPSTTRAAPTTSTASESSAHSSIASSAAVPSAAVDSAGDAAIPDKNNDNTQQHQQQKEASHSNRRLKYGSATQDDGANTTESSDRNVLSISKVFKTFSMVTTSQPVTTQTTALPPPPPPPPPPPTRSLSSSGIDSGEGLIESEENESAYFDFGAFLDASGHYVGFCSGCEKWHTGVMWMRRGFGENCLRAWEEILLSGRFDTDQESLDEAERSGACVHSLAFPTKHLLFAKDYIAMVFSSGQTFLHMTSAARMESQDYFYKELVVPWLRQSLYPALDPVLLSYTRDPACGEG